MCDWHTSSTGPFRILGREESARVGVTGEPRGGWGGVGSLELCWAQEQVGEEGCDRPVFDVALMEEQARPGPEGHDCHRKVFVKCWEGIV